MGLEAELQRAFEDSRDDQVARVGPGLGPGRPAGRDVGLDDLGAAFAAWRENEVLDALATEGDAVALLHARASGRIMLRSLE